MADYDQLKQGAVSFPLGAVTTPAKVLCNPAIAGALDFYTAMLQRYLGPYWDAMVPTIGMSEYVGKVVGEKVPYDPFGYGYDANRKFPLLCLFRTSEQVTEFTRAWDRIESIWTLQWVLPTCTVEQYLHISQMLTAARSILVDRTHTGFDPTYLSGADVWLPILGEGYKIGVKSIEYGHWTPTKIGEKTDLRFPVLQMEIHAWERRQSTPGLSDFVEFTTSISIGDSDETIVVETQLDLS